MKALKDNKVYTVDEQSKGTYLAQGYDIYDDDGNLIEHSPRTSITVAEHEKIVSDLKAQINLLTSDKQSLQEQVSKLTSDNTNLQSQIGKLTADNKTLQSQVSKLTADNKTLQESNAALVAKNKDLQDQIDKLKPNSK